jgi:hypothetical protein
MRKQIFFGLFLGVVYLPFNLLGQSDPDRKFLFRDSKVRLSTFYVEFAPSTNFSSLNGEFTGVTTFSGGLLLNERYQIGFFSDSSPKLSRTAVPQPGTAEYQQWLEAGVELDRLPEGVDTIFVRFSQAGFHLAYLHNTTKTVFWRAGLRLGLIGGVRLSEQERTFLGLFDNPIYTTSVTTLAPEVGVGVNLLTWWRVHFDVGYRLLAAGKSKEVLTAEDYDSFTMRLGFSFGAFNRPRSSR